MTSGIYPASLGDLEARNADGTGNNFANPEWGSDGVYVRVSTDASGGIINSYDDNLGAMAPGPAPRAISNAILAQPQVAGNDVDLPNAAGVNEFFQFFGQFITHDITQAAAGDRSIEGEVLLPRPAGLPRGLDFVRSGFSIDGNAVRQQFTIETSFLDLSMVYGANSTMLGLLRDNVAGVESAKLLTSAAGVLPTFLDVATDNPGMDPNDVLAVNGGVTSLGAFDADLFVSGDDRTNQSAALITHHTVWMREHNYQVDRLSAQFPSWSQEKLFQAARAITEAEWQNVIYSEYLPKLVGEDALSDYAGYKDDVDPSVINEWATVAFRFGHDQSSNSFATLDENGAPNDTFTLATAFQLANASEAIRNASELDDWVRGQLSHQTQEIDGKIVSGNRNLLFGGGVDPDVDPFIDLNVLDIQRGRDHGVGNYNTLRAGLKLAPYASFQAFAADNGLDPATLTALIDVYGTIDKLDSIVGGLLEKHVAGSQLGAMFTRLTVMQFENIRDGDRFYYEHRFKDDPALIADIKSTSLADIIGRNTGIQYMYHDAFAAHERIGGSAGNETLNGTGKKDLLTGYAGDDVANGWAGDDDLYGGEGNDYLRGHGGTDRLAGENGNDTLEGGSGADRLDGGAGSDTASYVDSAAVAINLQNGGASGGDADGDALTSIEHLIGSDSHDSLTGNGEANQLSGGGGNDSLFGGAGDDVINGNDGNDYLDGGDGIDQLNGGTGNDALLGAGGNDVLNGDDGNDYLDGGVGADIMRGGAGDDIYFVDNALDFVSDSSGTDTVYASVDYTLAADSGIESLVILGGGPVSLIGSFAANVLMGGGGADRLDGQAGNDKLHGGAGNDKVYGGKGVDYLAGDSGNDWLFGGSEKDTLVGGTGKDVFVFNTKPSKKSNFDKVSDFNVRYDSVALDNAIFKKIGRGTDTKIGKLSKNYFEVGSKADDRNDYVIYNNKTGILYYDSDGSGKTKAIEIAQLKKGLKMTYNDFLII